MKKANRLQLHFCFWLVYFSITLFNELYLTSDFAGDNTWNNFIKVFIGEVNLLSIKILLVYYVLYSVIPRWIKAIGKKALLVEAIAVLLAGVITYRLTIQFVNWRIILQRIPENLTTASLVARFFFSLLEILQIVGIAATIRLFRMRLANVENEKELIRARMKAELGHLKSQINPHFLFNTLNSIYSLSLVQSPQTPEVVLRLSSLLRFMLYESEKTFISVNDEIKIINDYVEMQQLRFENRVQVSRVWDVDNGATRIAPLLLFPFVENAFKHGIGTKNDNAFIDVNLTLQDGQLKMVTRNFILKESVSAKDDSGIGLTNLKKQLQLLYGEYDLKTEEQGMVFETSLFINLKSYAGNELYNSGR